MKKANIVGALGLLFFSILYIFEAIKMPIFERQSPGPGFIPFCIGILVMIFSSILLLQNLRSDYQKGKSPFMEKKEGLKTIAYIIIFLFAYCGFMILVGYPISTFFFLLFFLRVVGKYSYKFSFKISIVATAALHGIFAYWLDMAFPIGILIPL